MFSFYFLYKTKMYNKKWRIPVCLFDKSRTQDNVKCYIPDKVSRLKIIHID